MKESGSMFGSSDDDLSNSDLLSSIALSGCDKDLERVNIKSLMLLVEKKK